MASPIELATPDHFEYNFFPNKSGFLRFRVKAANNACIALSSCPAFANPIYEVFIGGWKNNISAIRKNRKTPDKMIVTTPEILKSDEFRGFWIRWHDKKISAGHEGDQMPFLYFTDTDSVPINYIGVRTGCGSTGNWIIEQDCVGTADGTCWVPAKNGEIPPCAFQGGIENDEPIYVARAHYKEGLIPGKISSTGTCCVSLGGKENPVTEYQVLCYFCGTWKRCHDNNIPANALAGGKTEDGERLYIGRVIHKSSLIVGKVQASHGLCYIPFNGQEVGFADYEILVS